jgi:hypothetical protein
MFKPSLGLMQEVLRKAPTSSRHTCLTHGSRAACVEGSLSAPPSPWSESRSLSSSEQQSLGSWARAARSVPRRQRRCRQAGWQAVSWGHQRRWRHGLSPLRAAAVDRSQRVFGSAGGEGQRCLGCAFKHSTDSWPEHPFQRPATQPACLPPRALPAHWGHASPSVPAAGHARC